MELNQTSNLTLECLAIGSLPHNNADKAMDIVNEYFATIPFWPQLAKVSKNEDMLIQYLENMPSFFIDDNNGKVFLNSEYESFFDDLEEFFLDYEEIINNINCEKLDKYAISKNYSSTFHKFIDIIKETTPAFAKGQIVGPFTLATTLCDASNKCAIYDETLKEIIVKNLTLKALWQIKEIKLASPTTTPIIFIDEPSISQLGTSAYLTISEKEVVEMIKEISDTIKNNGGISAIHCCGKCDWNVPILSQVNILNMDAYSYSQNLSLYASELKTFLNQGGKLAFGIVPTLDKEALAHTNIEILTQKFYEAVKYLTNKGIDEKIIIDNSIITPSCGAGSLDETLALKAMRLTKELSTGLKEQYLKR